MFVKLKQELKEFGEFAAKGNVVDMAVGIIIGASFSTIVNTLVNDVIMPPIGFVLGKVDFSNLYLVIPKSNVSLETIFMPSYATMEAAQQAGEVVVGYGKFINSVISFLIVAFAVFLLVKGINKIKIVNKAEEDAQEAKEPTTKACPRCTTEIPINATKCPHCTADI